MPVHFETTLSFSEILQFLILIFEMYFRLCNFYVLQRLIVLSIKDDPKEMSKK
jgi:hypothetical protein